jgi:hypothetical protein
MTEPEEEQEPVIWDFVFFPARWPDDPDKPDDY